MRIFSVTIHFPYVKEEEKEASRVAFLERLCGFGVDVSGITAANWYVSAAVTSDTVADLVKAGISVTITSETKVSDGLASAASVMVATAEKHDEQAANGGPRSQYNQRCEVYMPGNGLMTFNATLLLEDACCDVLQESLDKGWRVIAACPQPEQRRPDYILGRFDPEREFHARAERKA